MRCAQTVALGNVIYSLMAINAENQWAVTPGQSVVIYESRVCIGGGIIESARPAQPAPSFEEECPPDTQSDEV